MSWKKNIWAVLHKHKHWLVILLLPVAYQLSCKKNIEYRAVPIVSTANISDISPTTALSGGRVISDAGSDVSARGICYSIHPLPTITDHITLNGNGTGSYASEIKGLSPNTKYYLRAYAINYNGSGYGEEFSFTTLPEQSPLVITLPLKDISFYNGNRVRQ